MNNQRAREICRLARRGGWAGRWDAAPGLGALLVTGPDSTSFLQAQLTSDVAALGPGQGQASARLDRRGALVSWFHVLRLPDRGQPFPGYFLVLPNEWAPALLGELEAYVFAEDVLLENVGRDFEGLVLQGAGAEELPARAQVESADLLTWPVSLTGEAGLLCLQTRAAGGAALDRILAAAAAAGWAVDGDDLADAGARCTAWRWLTLEAGWPRLGVDLQPGQRALAQTGLEQHVISWTKGCYLGQEVVARIRTYGSVPRALRGLVFTGQEPDLLDRLPDPGEKLCSPDGRVLGTWASSGWSAALEQPVALAFLDRDSRVPGRECALAVAHGQATATVELLPLHSARDHAERAERLHGQAVRLYSRGQDDQAIALLEEALGLDPSRADTYEALGVILGRGERYHEAIDIFRRLEEVAPDEPMVHTNLSLFYMKVGDRQEAERQKALGTLKRFGNTDPDSLRQVQEAEAEALRRDALRREAMYAQVLEIDPDDALALAGMGQVHSDLGRWDQAEACLARALQGQPDNSPLYLAHGKVLQLLGQTSEAAAVFRQGVQVASRKGDLQPLREMEHRLALLQGAAAAD